MNMRRQKGFTLIELLIVVAIIGIIAAIAIPNLLNAINRGRQKRSMADMRSLGTALESYSVDFNYYPRVAIASAAVTAWQVYLTPTYMRRIPELDGWARQYLAKTSTTGQAYTIWSKGRAGTAATDAAGGPRSSFDDAIVFTNGTFVQWPEGLQTN
jgi:general secretion pathway protein G